MFLDSKLNFSQHLKTIFQKTDKTIGPLCKLQTLLPRAILITIYKLFIRPHLNFGDISSNVQYVVSTKMVSIQYNAALATTVALRGSSREKLYQELGLKTLQQRR